MKSPVKNILFIMCDQLRADHLSCYGHPHLHTPNIDRLATQGIRFTQAYANACVCSPTRTALITGRWQQRLPVGLEVGLEAVGPEGAGGDADVSPEQAGAALRPFRLDLGPRVYSRVGQREVARLQQDPDFLARLAATGSSTVWHCT